MLALVQSNVSWALCCSTAADAEQLGLSIMRRQDSKAWQLFRCRRQCRPACAQHRTTGASCRGFSSPVVPVESLWLLGADGY